MLIILGILCLLIVVAAMDLVTLKYPKIKNKTLKRPDLIEMEERN